MEFDIPFFVAHIDDTEKKLIDEVLEGSNYMHSELEDAFIQYTGAKFALATNSGTSALHLAMCALDLKRGDKVICSVNAFPSAPEVVRHFDAEPLFVDIDENNFNMDLDKLEKVLVDNNSKKLKAIIMTHLGGQTVDLDRLYQIADYFDVKVIEDASEAFGATYKGKPIGNTGADITIFSFSPHLKSGISRGGILLTNKEDIKTRATVLRNHGMEINDEDETLGYIYEVTDIGCQYRISELDAAYALAKLQKIEKDIQRRKDIAAYYEKRLKEIPHITVPTHNEEHSFDLFIIKVDKNRDSFARALQKYGIETGLHYIPINLLQYYKNKYNLRVNDFPVSLKNYQQVLSLPCYYGLSDKDIEFICDKIEEIAKKHI